MNVRRLARLALNRATNVIVGPLEPLILPAEDFEIKGPVFIVGPPRSGSTLLYQLVAAALDVGYLTNRHCRWFRAPALIERCSSTPFGTEIVFRSTYGNTEGAHSPSECGPFWYRFLPRRPHSLEVDSVHPHKLMKLRRSVSALAAAAGRPMVFKNLILSLRIPVIGRAFPNAFFVVVRRNRLDTAASILHARKRLFGRVDRWFSVRPSGCEKYDDPIEQVVEQVEGVYAEIEGARRKFGDHMFFDVSYERLCSSPEAVLRELADAASSRNISLIPRRDFQCPDAFEIRSVGIGEEPEWWRELRAAFAKRDMP